MKAATRNFVGHKANKIGRGDSRLGKKAFQISFRMLFVTGIFFLVATGTMFVVGVYVGRGMSPIRFEVNNLYQELGKVKEAMVQAEKKREKKLSSQLEFYERLDDNDDDLAFAPRAPESQKSPAVISTPTVPEPVEKKAMEIAPVPVVEKPTQVQPLILEKSDSGSKTKSRAASEPKAGARQDFKWAVQIMSYTLSKDAEGFVDNLSRMGYAAYISEAEIPDKGTFYRIRLGPFTSRDKAKQARIQVVKNYPDALVVRE